MTVVPVQGAEIRPLPLLTLAQVVMNPGRRLGHSHHHTPDPSAQVAVDAGAEIRPLTRHRNAFAVLAKGPGAAGAGTVGAAAATGVGAAAGSKAGGPYSWVSDLSHGEWLGLTSLPEELT